MKSRKHLLTHVFISLSTLPFALQPAAARNLPAAVDAARVAAGANGSASVNFARPAGDTGAGVQIAQGENDKEEPWLKKKDEKQKKDDKSEESNQDGKKPAPQDQKPQPPIENVQPSAPQQPEKPQQQAPDQPKVEAPAKPEPPKERPKPDAGSSASEPAAKQAPKLEKAPQQKPAAKHEGQMKPKAESAPAPETKPADASGSGSSETPKEPPKLQKEQPAVKTEAPKSDAGSSASEPAAKQAPKLEQAPQQKPATKHEGQVKPKAESAPAPETKPADASGSGSSEKPKAESAPAPEAKPSQAETAPKPEADKPSTATQDGKVAPAPDSAKEQPANSESVAPATGGGGQTNLKARPRPKSDAEAQSTATAPAPVNVAPATTEKGIRMDHPPRFDAPGDAKVEGKVDGRDILRIMGKIVVRGADADRFDREGGRTEYEKLPDGRTREVLERRNGVRIVTIRNRYGDVIQRSRVGRDGQQVVLFYDPELERHPDRDRIFRDPSLDLRPLRLTVPEDQYILDTSRSRDRDYYDFLREPPLEHIPRVFSLDEVRYSARVRDVMPRIDLDTILFATGSADIGPSEVRSLSRVAEAMNRIIDRNPAETFLIEGHTDAVGSDQANLVLSDQRAESVAIVLSDHFGIPPENLVTQGYGERFLKVQTQGPSQANRRVTIRRITPLVRPVNIRQ